MKIKSLFQEVHAQTTGVPGRINSEHKREGIIKETIHENVLELESMSFLTERVQHKDLNRPVLRHVIVNF